VTVIAGDIVYGASLFHSSAPRASRFRGWDSVIDGEKYPYFLHFSNLHIIKNSIKLPHYIMYAFLLVCHWSKIYASCLFFEL